MRGSQAAAVWIDGPDQIQITDAGMTVDQILESLRFVAMGRPNHPKVVELAEYLAKTEPKPEPVAAEDKPTRGRKKAE